MRTVLDLGYALTPGDVHLELPRAAKYHTGEKDSGAMSYEEAMFLYGLVSKESIVVMHDTSSEHPLRNEVGVKKLLKDLSFTVIELPSPRGLSLISLL